VHGRVDARAIAGFMAIGGAVTCMRRFPASLAPAQ